MVDRRLTAVMVADVVGYAKLVHQDEEDALARVAGMRESVIAPAYARHGGRIVKLMGDGVLGEFPSAAGAVRAAVEIQGEIAQQDRPLQLRVGINLGDVIHDADGDIHGDGVNVAARLEPLAVAGGICISEAVYQQVRDRVEADFADGGEQQLKNIDRPIRTWRWPAESARGAVSATVEKPSIAVLPFECLSGDPEHETFADGLADEVIATLSKVSSLYVVARSSSFAYKGKSVDVRQIGRELGVRYVLEGGLRAGSGRIRVTAQLIDAATGHHLWSDRYDRRLDDIFAIQDEITREIVTELRVELSDGAQAQLWLRGTDSVDAWLLALQAHERIMQATAERIREGRALVVRALKIDPEFAAAHALLAQAYWFELRFGFHADREQTLAEMGAAAERALGLEPTLGTAHLAMAGHALERGDAEAARRFGQSAVDLVPMGAKIRASFGRVLVSTGDPEAAEPHLRLALRLDPHGAPIQHGVLANALERQGKDDEAVAVLQAAVARFPDYFAGHLRLAALLGHRGDLDAGRRAADEVRRLRGTVDRAAMARFYGDVDPDALKRFLGGLESVGLL